jgi:hypothetical protein
MDLVPNGNESDSKERYFHGEFEEAEATFDPTKN